MSDKKSLVEEAVLQMKNLEDVIAENAKGILASTMKEEIKELVKESLSEQEEEEVEDEENVDMEDPELGAGDIATMDMSDTEGDDMEDEDEEEEEEDMEDEEDAIDLTNKSDEEVLRVFKLMGPDDNIVVTKDESGNINIKDADKEYMIVGEGVEEMDEEEDMEMEMDEQISADEMEDISSDIFGDDENLYELEMDEESDLMGDADFEEG